MPHGNTEAPPQGAYREFTHDPGQVPANGFTRVYRGPAWDGDLNGLRAMFVTRAITILNRSAQAVKVQINAGDEFYVDAGGTPTVDAFGNQLADVETIEDLPEGATIDKITVTPADGTAIGTDANGDGQVILIERTRHSQADPRRHR